MDEFRYSRGRLKYIASNYEKYGVEEISYFDDIWSSGSWQNIIESKADFDVALRILTKDEKYLVFAFNTQHVKQRNRVFDKMVKYLNGEPYEHKG